MKLNDVLVETKDDPRVAKGIRSQEYVVDHFKGEYGDDFEVISVAGRSQKSPDIVANLHGHKTIFEVKLRDRVTDPVTLYEVMLPRGGRDPMLDAFARAESGGKAKTFTDFVDLARKTDPSRGWPGDHADVPATGGIFFSSTDATTIDTIRRRLMSILQANHNDYFVITTANTGRVDVYDVGTTNPTLKAPRLPNISRIIVKTYGAGYLSKKTGLYGARIAVKAVFAK